MELTALLTQCLTQGFSLEQSQSLPFTSVVCFYLKGFPCSLIVCLSTVRRLESWKHACHHALWPLHRSVAVVRLRAEHGGRLLLRGCAHKAQALSLLSCLKSKVGRLDSVVSLKSIYKQCIQGVITQCKMRPQTSCSICDQS